MAKVTVSVPKKVTRKKAVAKKASKKVAKKAAKKVAKKVQLARYKNTVSDMRAAMGSKRGSPVSKYALTGLPWVLAVTLGSLLFFKSRQSSGAQAPIAPLPGLEPAPSRPTEPAPIVEPEPSPQDRLDLEFRRAKAAEIPRDILLKAKQFTSQPIGAIFFAKSSMNGKEYAFVLEQHTNLPKGDGGVSMFIHR